MWFKMFHLFGFFFFFPLKQMLIYSNSVTSHLRGWQGGELLWRLTHFCKHDRTNTSLFNELICSKGMSKYYISSPMITKIYFRLISNAPPQRNTHCSETVPSGECLRFYNDPCPSAEPPNVLGVNLRPITQTVFILAI